MPERIELPSESSATEHREREDHESNARQQERDPDDDSEHRESLGHVAHVQGHGESGLGHPDVPGAVRDGLTGGVLGRCGLVVRARLVSWLRSRLEAAHRRIVESAGGLERVHAHDLRECSRLIAGRDLLAGPLVCVLRDGRITGWAKRDPLRLDRVAGRVVPVDAHEDCGDAEQNQHRAGEESADLPILLALHRSTSRMSTA